MEVDVNGAVDSGTHVEEVKEGRGIDAVIENDKGQSRPGSDGNNELTTGIGSGDSARAKAEVIARPYQKRLNQIYASKDGLPRYVVNVVAGEFY